MGLTEPDGASMRRNHSRDLRRAQNSHYAPNKMIIFTKMLKIGIECENLEDAKSRWGVGHLVLNLLKEYATNPEYQKKVKLYLYFKSKIPSDVFLQNPIFVKKVLKLPFVNSFNLFYHIMMPLRAMLDRVDMIFFPSYNLPPLYFGKSIVMLTPDVYYEYKTGTLPFKYKLAYRLFSNWAAKKATKILAISEASKKELIKLYGVTADRIFVAKLGVSPKDRDKRQETSPYVLFVGQMFPRRRAAETLLAFKTITPDFPDMKFILIGKDKYNPPSIAELVKKINEELGGKRIIHHEYIESDAEVVDLYRNAKLFIYISSSEAFGLPPVEAASYGVPVVVKDCELNHELFGDAAFFVKNEYGIDGIADAIKDGLTNTEKRNYCLQKYKELTPKLNWRNFADNFFKACENY